MARYLLVLLILTFSAPAASTDEADVRALIIRYYAAANAKDVKGVMSCYATTDDILVFDVVPARPFKGVDAVTKDWSDYFAAMKVIDLEPAEIEVVVAGDIAYSHFIERVMTSALGARQMKLGLRTTHVYRKISGKWLIVHEHKSKSLEAETSHSQ